MLPAASLAIALRLVVPTGAFAGIVVVSDQLPFALTVVVPTFVVPKSTVTDVAPPVVVPLKVTVDPAAADSGLNTLQATVGAVLS